MGGEDSGKEMKDYIRNGRRTCAEWAHRRVGGKSRGIFGVDLRIKQSLKKVFFKKNRNYLLYPMVSVLRVIGVS